MSNGEEVELDENETPVSSEQVLDNEEADQFVEALHLGAASGTATVLGHEIDYRLVNVREELAIGKLISEFEGTQARTKAYKVATVAASIVAIDGEPFYTPLSPDENTVAKRFERLQNYYSIFIDEIYSQVIEKETEVGRKLLEKLSKSKG